MILQELFDAAAVPYQLNGDIAKFQVGGLNYLVDFIYFGQKRFEVAFSVEADKENNEGEYKSHITGTGNEVFSTVIAIIREFITTTDVWEISFTAEISEPSRIKLYDRMVQSLANGWAVESRVGKAGKVKAYKLINPKYSVPKVSDDIQI